MKYYIECTVNKKDPLTGRTIETDVDLSLPYLVDVEPSQMNADFDPATPAPRMWWETDSGKDENNDYYTSIVYTATDDGEPDFDNMVAGASMDACEIWEEKKA